MSPSNRSQKLTDRWHKCFNGCHWWQRFRYSVLWKSQISLLLSTSVVTDRITVTTKLHNFDSSPDEHVGNDILYLRDIILSNQIRLHDCVSILKKKKPTTTKNKKNVTYDNEVPLSKPKGNRKQIIVWVLWHGVSTESDRNEVETYKVRAGYRGSWLQKELGKLK